MPQEPEANPNPTEPPAEPTNEPGQRAGLIQEPEAEPTPEFEPLTAEALTLPEGFEVSEEHQTQFLDLVNAQGKGEITPAELANKLLELQAAVSNSVNEKVNNSWTETQSAWEQEVRSDPEIGGDKLDQTLASIQRTIDQFGSPEVYKALTMTGAGNNPAIVRFLAKVSKQFQEGNPINPGAAEEQISPARKLFPSMEK